MEEVKIHARALVIEKKIQKYNESNYYNVTNIFTRVNNFNNILDDKITENTIQSGNFASGINQYLTLGNITRARGYVECFEELVKLLE